MPVSPHAHTAPVGRRVARDFLSVSLASVANRAINFIAVVFLARTLGPAGYGDVSWAQAALVVGTCLADLGLNTQGIRVIAEDRGHLSETLSRYVSLRLVLSLLGAGAVVAVGLLSAQSVTARHLAFLYALTLLLNGLGLEWLFIGLQSMPYVGLARVLQASLYAALLWMVVRGPGQILLVPILTGLAALVALALLLVVFARRFPEYRFHFSLRGWRSILATSLPLGLADMLIQVYISLPLLVIGWFWSAEITGYYSGAYRIQQVLQELLGWFFISLYPVAAFRWKQMPEQIPSLLDRVLKIVLGLTIPFAFGAMSVAPTLLTLALGERYAGSVLPFQVLCWNLVAAGAGAVFKLLVLLMSGRQREYLGVIAVGAVVGTALNLALIPLVGSVGAALSWVLSETCVGIAAWRLSRPLVSIRFWPRFWPPLLSGAVMAAVTWGLGMAGVSVWLVIPAGVTLYLAVLVLVRGIDRSDLRFLRSLVGKTALAGS